MIVVYVPNMVNTFNGVYTLIRLNTIVSNTLFLCISRVGSPRVLRTSSATTAKPPALVTSSCHLDSRVVEAMTIKATVKIYYESRLAKISLTEEGRGKVPLTGLFAAGLQYFRHRNPIDLLLAQCFGQLIGEVDDHKTGKHIRIVDPHRKREVYAPGG